MLHFRAVLSVIAAFAVGSCGGSSGGTEPTQNPPPGPGPGPAPGPGASASVTVGNNSYSPGQVSVARGGTVTWRWDSCTGDPYGTPTCVAHSVTFDDGGPSAAAKEDGSFARTFAGAGTFTYYCTTHGRAVMSGSVVVP